MTPLERKAAFRAAVTLRQITMAEAAAEMGVSYNHLTLVINGERVGSARLEEAISRALNRSVAEVFARTTRRPSHKR
ncbi:MAG TPA: helix-turn-helix transcriptional regulator [Gemmatimonadaceae bacterium]